MITIKVDNVNQALDEGMSLLQEHGREEPSRAGPVLVMPCPVTTVYARPRERVLFSPLRDANPFFHLAESLWMLAGRRDAAFLNNFVSDFGERFAEPSLNNLGHMHDAYGHRWRHQLGFDQLNEVVKQLTEKPESRQAVIQMWDATNYPDDMRVWHEASDDLCGEWRTRPCNTHAYLRIRSESVYRDTRVGNLDPTVANPTFEEVLDLTVLCRSNDIWWGAYGANAVHFSVLQEYLAARLDVGVGNLIQFSNNYHVYRTQMDQLEERRKRLNVRYLLDDRYRTAGLRPAPLVHDAESFDEEVVSLLQMYENKTQTPYSTSVHHPRLTGVFNNGFLSNTVWPMLMAHFSWKNKLTTKEWLEVIEAPDWRVASTEWINRRTKP